jgi:hypothetical protein
LPAPDLLVHGAHLNYHVGAGVLVAATRALGRLPMSGAYVASVAYLVALSASLLAAFARRARLLPSGPLASGVALALAFVCSGYVSWNLPTLTALPLLFSGLLFLRVRSPMRRALALAPLLLLLALTKEVHFAFLLLAMVLVAAPHVRQERRAMFHWIAPGLALLFGQWAQRALLRPEQMAHLGLFHERLGWDVLRAQLQQEYGFIYTVPGSAAQWLFATLVVGLFSWHSLRGIQRQVALIATCMYAVGAMLTLFVRPSFSPPMDAFSYKWLLFDMEQFEKTARLFLFVVLSLLSLGAVLRRTKASRGAGVSLIAGLLALHVVYTWQSLPVGPAREHPEERGDDDIWALLEQIPTRGTLVAADQFNWNDENPHWAAFRGHQFLALRKGRWTSSLPGHGRVLGEQATLFLSNDQTVGVRTARALGVTHIVVPKERGIPWLRGVPPHLSTSRWAAYEVGRLP